MKVAIFAGGEGSRLRPDQESIPKPLVRIGDRPIIWHIMKMYATQGIKDFILLLGHKADDFKVLNDLIEPDWKITFLNTGTDTMTGSRLFAAKSLLQDQTFMLTYADGLADIDFKKLLSFHQEKKKTITATGINPRLPYGLMSLTNDGTVTSFQEKPRLEATWINGGFFVCEPKIFEYLSDDKQLVFENAPLEKVATAQELVCYKHAGFWDCMDHPQDQYRLNELWNRQQAPWKKWS